MPVPRALTIPAVLAAALTAALAGCGGDGAGSSTSGITGTTSSTSDAVRVADNSFTPSATTVPPGTTVTWTWVGTREDHNVTFADGTASATQASGTYQRTFAAAGTFPYYCTIHGTPMSGVVTVR
jgi:plastocyanin